MKNLIIRLSIGLFFLAVITINLSIDKGKDSQNISLAAKNIIALASAEDGGSAGQGYKACGIPGIACKLDDGCVVIAAEPWGPLYPCF